MGKKEEGEAKMFSIEELTIRHAATLLEKGDITSEVLVQNYLDRISLYDQGEEGLNAICEVNPDALSLARQLDEERKEKGARSLLHGIPILVKDNISTADKMHTSAGSLALADLYAPYDAFIIQKLRESGAILLGKTNMGEFANFMSYTMPDGYSSRGGQVRNPYDSLLTPSGSSSGSAVATAANLAMAAIGTETNGSLTMPARYNQLVTIKPTVGLVSRSGIIPISYSQDTAGPMTRSVEDTAILLGVMAGRDSQDETTDRSIGRIPKDYLTTMRESLEGKRIGYNKGAFRQLDEQGQQILLEALQVMERAGATIVETEITSIQDDFFTVSLFEFKVGINAYLHTVKGHTKMQSLTDIIAFNKVHEKVCLKYGQEILEEAQNTSGTLNDPYYIRVRQGNLQRVRTKGIDYPFAKDHLDAFMTMEISSLAPVSGYPCIAVPAGFKKNGEPMSMLFIGKAFSEARLISMAYHYEQGTRKRKAPIRG